jgi:hypothetical protein
VCLYIKYNLLCGLHAIADIYCFFEDVISAQTIERAVKVALNGGRERKGFEQENYAMA